MRHAGRSLLRPLLLALALLAPLPLTPAALASGPESVADLAANLSPAVVNIGTSRKVPLGNGAPFPEFPEGSPLKDLFDDLNPNQGQGEEAMREACRCPKPLSAKGSSLCRS